MYKESFAYIVRKVNDTDTWVIFDQAHRCINTESMDSYVKSQKEARFTPYVLLPNVKPAVLLEEEEVMGKPVYNEDSFDEGQCLVSIESIASELNL
jgi:hypothetical protein